MVIQYYQKMSRRQPRFQPPPPPQAQQQVSQEEPAVGANQFSHLIRMLIVQSIQSKIMGVKKFPTPIKLLLFFGIFITLCAYDVSRYLNDRPQNLYELIGVGRGANASEIGMACDNYSASVKEVVQQIEEGYLDKVVLQQRFKLTLDQLEDLRVTLTNDELRDIYEKVGQQTTAADYQERKGHVPQAVRYMQALGSSMQLAGFFMLVFVFIEKHQVFAKQVSMTSLLLAIYTSVYMRFPKEGDRDNDLAALVNGLPFLQNLTIHEKATLLVTTFANLFQFIMSLSRLIDGNPTEDVKMKYKKFQKKSFNSQLLCELMSPMRVVAPELPVDQPAVLVQEGIEGEVQPQSIPPPPPVQALPPAPTDQDPLKKELFDAFHYVGKTRQVAFIATYKTMIEEKKRQLEQMGKFQKIKRNFMKIVIAIGVLAIIYFNVKSKTVSVVSTESMEESTGGNVEAEGMFEEAPVYEESNKPYEYQEREEDYKFEEEVEYIDRDSL
ncbi:hypothetical protein FGO68_gene14645 [Halteria grandinella]|uniref:Uncharacterized protein n=1 Tax=Halteria grandinella TaxID=5974 RepID=A0A8J8NR82_HALGN|nr:hypothetical protein FGO68_gene14645 [Halteria grandinella]